MKNKITSVGLFAVATLLVSFFWQGLLKDVSVSNGQVLPQSRPFKLGFTPFPYDFTTEASDWTYNAIANDGDMILYHLDNGVPWDEALAGDNQYPPTVLEEINDMKTRKLNTLPNHKLYVSTTAQASNRTSLAGYWNEDHNLPLMPYWANRKFDDPVVITAFLNWSRYLINTFQPDYFAYGIETTYGFSGPNDPKFQDYLVMAQSVYPTLKLEYPSLPIFLTFTTGGFGSTRVDHHNMTQQLAAYSDYMGVSTYPWSINYLNETNTYEDPALIPNNWLSEMASLAPGKPFAITETGYIAEDLVMSFGTTHGNPTWQSEYVDKILQQAYDLNAKFVSWFIIADYDQGWQRLQDGGIADEVFKIWRDTGLYYGNLDVRPSWTRWKNWFSLPYSVDSTPTPTPPTEVQVFLDSFEISEWNGLWTEDSQNDWFRSSQRATDGTSSAEVDGSANNAKLISIPINLQGKNNAKITFSWLIESSLDHREYLAIDASTDKGLTWIEKAKLSGNIDPENVWLDKTIYLNDISSLKIRFRGKMSDASEDANVDFVRVLGY